MARPDREEVNALYALMHAAEAIDNRWSRETPEEFTERMHDRELSDEEETFLLTAWDILTNKHSGALGRILGAYSTLSVTFSDESLDYVAASPTINAMYNDSLIVPELVEGFEEAMAHNAVLEYQLSETKTLLRHTQEKLAAALARNSEQAQSKPKATDIPANSLLAILAQSSLTEEDWPKHFYAASQSTRLIDGFGSVFLSESGPERIIENGIVRWSYYLVGKCRANVVVPVADDANEGYVAREAWLEARARLRSNKEMQVSH